MTLAEINHKIRVAKAKLGKATHGLRIAERRVRHFKERARYFDEKGYPRDRERAEKNLRRWMKRQSVFHHQKVFLSNLLNRRILKRKKWEVTHQHTYGAGGWAPTSKWVMERVDQGQDFEIPLGERVRAPGDGEVVGHGEDRPFPYGFGHHLIVRIDTGPFAGRTYYIGHVEGLVDSFPVGHKFKKGDLLSQTNHYLNSGWGWVELGTYPYGPMGNGWNIHSLFHDVKE